MKKNKLICGFGINDSDECVTCIGDNGKTKNLLSYDRWLGMITRCYSEKYLIKKPSYIGCKVCDDWVYYSNFKKWFDINFRWDLHNDGLIIELDKDLLSDSDNKIYSPDTCVFIPRKVNSLVKRLQSNSTSNSTGVSWCKRTNRWEVRYSDFNTGARKYGGMFKSKEEAENSYRFHRSIQIELAKEYMLSLGYTEKICSCIK